MAVEEEEEEEEEFILVWALSDELCTVSPTLGCQACAVQRQLLFADHAVEGHGLGSEVSETRISMHSAQRQASS